MQKPLVEKDEQQKNLQIRIFPPTPPDTYYAEKL